MFNIFVTYFNIRIYTKPKNQHNSGLVSENFRLVLLWNKGYGGVKNDMSYSENAKKYKCAINSL